MTLNHIYRSILFTLWEFDVLRIFGLLFFLTLLPSLSSANDSLPSSLYNAGISRLSVADVEGNFDTMIWYPIADAEKAWQAGPFTVAATLGAPIVSGKTFPIVLLSHGSGGTPMAHRELAASLARSGLVVVAPIHVGDAAGHPRLKPQAKVLITRPRQAKEAIAAVIADRRFSGSIDANRMGMIGYSAGGYTGLILAGAKADFQLASDYCAADGRKDIGSCGPSDRPAPEARELVAGWQAPAEPRIKALVLMDPLAIMFDEKGLTGVGLPTQLFQPNDDAYLNASHNALALSRDLPSHPVPIVVPGQHFIFIDPCPDLLMKEVPQICRDGAEIDRPSIHRKLQVDVANFLHKHL
jgi:predicted dienelactone hydrolase